MKNKKGFTLVEMLVVVLIIGILAAIAMPSYRASVEKSRATQGITSLTQIAKAQKTYSFKRGNYAEEMLSLPVDITDVNGANATGSEYSDQYFDYKIFGDEFGRARATRNTGEYELSIDYGTGEIFCRPIENKVCASLGFAEGYELISWPQTEECKASLYKWSDNAFSCVRTLYKDGTKQDRVCAINTAKGISCYIYDNNGKNIKTISSHPGTGAFMITTIGDVYKESFQYSLSDGSFSYYNKYLVDGNKLLESYGAKGAASYQTYNYGDTTERWYTYLTGSSPRTHYYVDGVQVSVTYYDKDGKGYWRNYFSEDKKVIESIQYNSDGTIKSYTCTSGPCTEEGYTPPSMESLGHYPTNLPQVPNYCENDPEEPELCSNVQN